MGVEPVTILINAVRAKTGGGFTYLSNMLPRLAADKRIDVHICLQPEQVKLYEHILTGVTVHRCALPKTRLRELWHEQVEIRKLAHSIGAASTFSLANFGPIFAPGHVVLLRNALVVGFLERRLSKVIYWSALWIMTALSVIFASRVIAVSAYAIGAASGGVARLLPGKVRVIHHGRSDAFRPMPRLREEEVVRGRLLIVSDIYVQKNFLAVIRALTKIAESVPNVSLDIAGATIDAAYRTRVERSIVEHGLEARVRWLGRLEVSALVDALNCCDLFVFPSTVETFGNPLVEAMACGCPIACSNSAAMPEIVGDAAAYFDPDDVGDITEVITRLLNDEQLRHQLSERAVSRAELFSWKETSRRTADVFIEVAQQ